MVVILPTFYIPEWGKRDVLFKISYPLITTFIVENKDQKRTKVSYYLYQLRAVVFNPG